jgi:hypothetical protein
MNGVACRPMAPVAAVGSRFEQSSSSRVPPAGAPSVLELQPPGRQRERAPIDIAIIAIARPQSIGIDRPRAARLGNRARLRACCSSAAHCLFEKCDLVLLSSLVLVPVKTNAGAPWR